MFRSNPWPSLMDSTHMADFSLSLTNQSTLLCTLFSCSHTEHLCHYCTLTHTRPPTVYLCCHLNTSHYSLCSHCTSHSQDGRPRESSKTLQVSSLTIRQYQYCKFFTRLYLLLRSSALTVQIRELLLPGLCFPHKSLTKNSQQGHR